MRPTLALIRLCAVFCFPSILATVPLLATDIVALCIGNDRYAKPEDVLDTPVADATLLAGTLRQIPGVRPEDVTLLTNGTREAMSAALRTFKAKAGQAKFALIFYSGHGMEDTPLGETKAETFLLPIDADITGIDVLPERAISLSQVLKAMDGTRAARAVILDCCRTGAPSANLALEGTTKNFGEQLADAVKRALGVAVAPEGTLIAFSAGPGRKAASYLLDEDIYSPFTHFFVESLKRDGGHLLNIVNQATATTKERTGGRQVPHTEVRGDISLIMNFEIPAIEPNASRGSVVQVLPLKNTTSPMYPSLALTGPITSTFQPGFNEKHLVVSYKGSDGLTIRDSREIESYSNKHGDLMSQTTIPLRQVGELYWDGQREWAFVEVEGWVAIKNETKTFLEQQPDGRWKVIWNRRRDPLWMRTETHSKSDKVCGLSYATHLEELASDYTDKDYHYIYGKLSGWAVKRTQGTVYMKYADPD